MLPEDELKQIVTKYQIKQLSESVQNFYSNPCAAIEIENNKNLDEIITVIREMIDREDAKNS